MSFLSEGKWQSWGKKGCEVSHNCILPTLIPRHLFNYFYCSRKDYFSYCFALHYNWGFKPIQRHIISTFVLHNTIKCSSNSIQKEEIEDTNFFAAACFSKGLKSSLGHKQILNQIKHSRFQQLQLLKIRREREMMTWNLDFHIPSSKIIV